MLYDNGPMPYPQRPKPQAPPTYTPSANAYSGPMNPAPGYSGPAPQKPNTPAAHWQQYQDGMARPHTINPQYTPPMYQMGRPGAMRPTPGMNYSPQQPQWGAPGQMRPTMGGMGYGGSRYHTLRNRRGMEQQRQNYFNPYF